MDLGPHIHQFFERFPKFRIENRVNDWIYEAVHVPQPGGDQKC